MPAAPSSAVNRLRAQLAQLTNTEPTDWFPVFKARYGMAAVFGVLRDAHLLAEDASAVSPTPENPANHPVDVQSARRVVTQLFTCCTAIDPLLEAGMEPEYGDISPVHLSLSAADYTAQPGQVAVLLQHTFGLIDTENTRQWQEKIHQVGGLLVEDCAHCVARLSTDQQGQPLADISIHSFGVEKIMPQTRFGGAIYVNPTLKERNPGLYTHLTTALQDLKPLPWRLELATRAYLTQIRVFFRLPSALAKATKAFLRRCRLFEPAISPRELAGGLEYDNLAISPWTANRASVALQDLPDNLARRRENVRFYLRELPTLKGAQTVAGLLGNKTGQNTETSTVQPLLLFPLLLTDPGRAERVQAALRAERIYARRWYHVDLFPGVTDPAAYRIPTDRSGQTMHDRIKPLILGLPTDLSPERRTRAVEILRRTP